MEGHGRLIPGIIPGNGVVLEMKEATDEPGGRPMQPVLITSRLVLRPFHPSDAPAVRTLAGDFRVADTTLNVPHPYEDGLAEQWISSHVDQYEADHAVVFAMVGKESGALVGSIQLALLPRFRRAELGYWVGAPFWGLGYCTEAARTLIDFGFSVLNLHKISASHLTRNPASGRVMLKAGMAHEGSLRDHAFKCGRFDDIELYGILADDKRHHGGYEIR